MRVYWNFKRVSWLLEIKRE